MINLSPRKTPRISSNQTETESVRESVSVRKNEKGSARGSVSVNVTENAVAITTITRGVGVAVMTGREEAAGTTAARVIGGRPRHRLPKSEGDMAVITTTIVAEITTKGRMITLKLACRGKTQA